MTAVRFYIEKRPSKKRDHSLYAQVVLGTKGKFKLYPGIRVSHDLWDHESQRVINNDLVTSELEQMRQEILFEYRKLQRQLKRQPELAEFRNHVNAVLYPQQQADTGKRHENPVFEPLLPDVIGERLSDGDSLFSDGTKRMYRGLMANLQQFADKHTASLKLQEFDYGFYSAFQNFLIADQHYINDTANNQLKKLKAALNFFLVNKGGMLPDSEYNRLRRILKDQMRMLPTKKDNPRHRMELQEVLRFYRHDFSGNSQLELVRDRYVFCCFTGLRVGDLNKISNFNLVTAGGKRILRFNQSKGHKKPTTEVPLNQIALALLEKHSRADRPLLFPRVQGDTNELLRDALRACGGFDQPVEKLSLQLTTPVIEIKKRYELLTFHTSRHTFASYLLNQGMSLEYVQDMLGHASATTTAHYARADREAVIEKASQLLVIPVMKAV